MPSAKAGAATADLPKAKMSKTLVTPTMDHVLVEAEDQTESGGGIVLPKGMKDERVQIGRILGVGPGMYKHGVYIEPRVRTGQRVYFTPHGGYSVTHEGKKLHLVAEELIVALIE